MCVLTNEAEEVRLQFYFFCYSFRSMALAYFLGREFRGVLRLLLLRASFCFPGGYYSEHKNIASFDRELKNKQSEFDEKQLNWI